jgi:NAD(P)H-dependent FMN reductase
MKKHIVLISGSGSKHSHTQALLHYIATLLEEQGMKTTLWDLYEKPLLATDPDYHGDPMHPNLQVRKFIALVNSADGIVLGTPLYHGSFSGILKNALDNLGSDAFKNKHVGLVSNAGGMGNMQAVEQLRSVVRALYGYALQTQIVTTEEDYTVFAKTNKILITDAIKQRAKRLADELVFFTMLMEKQSKVL